MKKIILLFIFVCLGFLTKAQSPQAIPYQAIVRNASGNIISNQAVKLRFSIHDSLATGTVVYKEIHTLSTNAQGLVNVNIGQGSVQTGSFASIIWGKNGKFIQTELDALNNNTYIDLGTTQMMSVPYALYAEKSNNINFENLPKNVKIGFDSSTVWICPEGTYQITVELWGGAGGGGAGSAAYSSGTGTIYGDYQYTYYSYAGYVLSYIVGGNGGSGGNGGYMKSIMSVIPGNSYLINIGKGGKGGVGGLSYTGANGNNGITTNFAGVLFADGGIGGTGGKSFTGDSVLVGNNGSSGQVLNYSYPSNILGSRSYIPTGLISQAPGMFALAGSGGGRGVINFPAPLSGPIQSAGSSPGQNGSNGENGYCLITY
jgi:hypothetical protein